MLFTISAYQRNTPYASGNCSLKGRKGATAQCFWPLARSNFTAAAVSMFFTLSVLLFIFLLFSSSLLFSYFLPRTFLPFHFIFEQTIAKYKLRTWLTLKTIPIYLFYISFDLSRAYDFTRMYLFRLNRLNLEVYLNTKWASVKNLVFVTNIPPRERKNLSKKL